MRGKSSFFLSIIIPIYNAAPFLRQTIGSILSQDFEGLEIVLVNDGSTDGSLQICREYSSQFINVITIDQKNQGVSVARNIGLEVCNGEWVYFVDSDDEILSGCLKNVVGLLKKHCEKIDVLKVDRIKVTNDIEEDLVELPELLCHYNNIELYLSHEKKLAHSLWLYFFKRDLVLENTIRFTKGLKYCEDLEFVFKLLVVSKGILHTNILLYKYFVRDNSAMSKFYRVENALIHIDVLKRFIEFSNKYICCDLYKDYVKVHLLKSFLSCFVLSNYDKIEFNFCKQEYKNVYLKYNFYELRDRLLTLCYSNFYLGLKILKFRIWYLGIKK